MFFKRWISLAGWTGIAGGIGVCLLALSAFLAPNYWIADNMSFFLRQFLAAGVCGLAGGVTGLLVPHRKVHAYRRALFVLIVLLTTLGALMAARIGAVVPADRTASLAASGANPALRIVSINLESLFLADTSLTSYLEAKQPDVIIFEEVTWGWQQQRWARRVGTQPINGYGVYPDHLFLGKLGDIAVFSRYPIVRKAPQIVVGDAERNGDADREFLSFALDVNGETINIIAIHPASPRSKPRWQDRQKYLQSLDAEFNRLIDQNTGPTAVIGDWNLSPWSGHFLDFFTRNTAVTAFPNGIPQTTRFFYDYRLHWLLGAVVDHFAVTPDIGIANVNLGPDIGSDHLPLAVDLMLPGDTEAKGN